MIFSVVGFIKIVFFRVQNSLIVGFVKKCTNQRNHCCRAKQICHNDNFHRTKSGPLKLLKVNAVLIMSARIRVITHFINVRMKL